jgi:PTH1 family peptidyl-tRNA hydrolase
MRSVRLLIASLGNPPPYHSTRHSVGHIVLKHLASRLSLPPLTKSKLLGSGLVSSGADVGVPHYTLWQSASMMNISGQGTLKAWKAFTNLHPASEDVVTALVVLHDELESSLGAIKLRRGESSPKGHNGIKSVQSSLKSAGLLSSMGERFIKIGVGIGRPVSREKDDVSAWVLGQLTGAEKGKIEATTESLGAVLKSEIAKLERS